MNELDEVLLNKVEYGDIQNVWNVNYTRILKVQIELWHKGLNEHKVISASDTDILNNKISDQVAKWSDKWEKICEKKRIDDAKSASIEEATRRTLEAASQLEEIENILNQSLSVKNMVKWESLKKQDVFRVPYPDKVNPPKFIPYPDAPNKESSEYQPKLNIFTKIITPLKNKAIARAEEAIAEATNAWNKTLDEIENRNEFIDKKYQKDLEQNNKAVDKWNVEKNEFDSKQEEYNKGIDDLKERYFASDVQAILEYCGTVLDSSNLPSIFTKDFELDYNPDSKILIIDYLLPDISAFPNIKEAKYIATKNELKVSYHNDAFVEKLYDATIYKMILRVLHEEFEADVIDALDAISFNGWVNSINRATGKQEKSCIVSIQVQKNTYIDIELKNVDPKACFKSLRGVGSSKLAGITPIQPILTINKNDKRFVDSHDVTNTFDDSTNLAAVPWEEFEHLIRELFAAEFSANGGEVRVTQASRDGGVDAVAFDPDPIRGGKIVIQAKRYTNTVGVSAVRDLYGTVLNEGAIKGILVTTADYGPDAYDFAKNKPLTLLNGGHLLHLLSKHGHTAKIDLKEAKRLNMASE